jgi:predicted Zn-dependent protease
MTRGAPIVLLVALLSVSTACAGPMTSGPPPTSSDTGRAAPTTTTRVDPAQAARLQRIMLPLIRVMDHSMPPLAGQLVTSQYSRGEEYAADAHGVVLLRRAGYPKDMMVETLTWLMQVSGPDSGGFFATHPGTADRIAAVQKMP